MAGPLLHVSAELQAPQTALARPPFSCGCSFNKQVLKAFPYPITITALQFAIGSLLASTMWLLRLHKKPEGNLVENVGARLHLPPLQPHNSRRLRSYRGGERPRASACALVPPFRWSPAVCITCPPRNAQATTLSPLAVVHTLGNALTNISLGAVAVSFTHTIKALEPMFSGAAGAARAGRCCAAPRCVPAGRRGVWQELFPRQSPCQGGAPHACPPAPELGKPALPAWTAAATPCARLPPRCCSAPGHRPLCSAAVGAVPGREAHAACGGGPGAHHRWCGAGIHL